MTLMFNHIKSQLCLSINLKYMHEWVRHLWSVVGLSGLMRIEKWAEHTKIT
jgi:hypothetical protein